MAHKEALVLLHLCFGQILQVQDAFNRGKTVSQQPGVRQRLKLKVFRTEFDLTSI